MNRGFQNILGKLLSAISGSDNQPEDLLSANGSLNVGDGASGTPDYRRTGAITSMQTLLFPQAPKYVRVVPRGSVGTGFAKVAINAPSDAVAAAWLAMADTQLVNMMHRKVRATAIVVAGALPVPEPIENGEFYNPAGITRVDLLGDADISAVEVWGV